jgi:hypothetical protein
MDESDYLIGRAEMKKDIMDFIEAMSTATMLSEPEEGENTFFENKQAIWTTLQSLKNTLEKGVPVKPKRAEQN